jgi:hypothetical protein
VTTWRDPRIDPSLLPDAYKVREASPRERRTIHVLDERCSDHFTLQRVWNALLDAGYLDGVYGEATIRSGETASPWSVQLCMIDACDPAGYKRRFIFLGSTPEQSSSCELSTNVTDEELDQQIKLYTLNHVVDESSDPT